MAVPDARIFDTTSLQVGGATANRSLVEYANNAALRLSAKLLRSGIQGPKMDEFYRRRYFEPTMRRLVRKLQIATYHVSWAVALSGKPPSDVCLIDHGGGLGFIGLLAKEMGLRRVIYNDIDKLFLDAAQGIARAVDATADDYILGDIEDLVQQLDGGMIDALISYDVLEHIYDLDDFFGKLCRAPCAPNVLYLSSGANYFSPVHLSVLLPVHRRAERENSRKRRSILRDCMPGLSEDRILSLVEKTRTLVRSEIEHVAKSFAETGKLELPKKAGANGYDPFMTNTVDPETGWWAEHFTSPYHLSKVLRSYGFDAEVRAGFHDKRYEFVNPVIRILRAPLALPLAAFYTVCATKVR